MLATPTPGIRTTVPLLRHTLTRGHAAYVATIFGLTSCGATWEGAARASAHTYADGSTLGSRAGVLLILVPLTVAGVVAGLLFRWLAELPPPPASPILRRPIRLLPDRPSMAQAGSEAARPALADVAPVSRRDQGGDSTPLFLTIVGITTGLGAFVGAALGSAGNGVEPVIEGMVALGGLGLIVGLVIGIVATGIVGANRNH